MRQLACLLCLLLLTACITPKLPPAPDKGFSATGRLSIRSGNDAHYANFGWQSAPDNDRLSFANPLGQTVAELEVMYQEDVPVYAVLRDADGQAQSGEPETLLYEATGMQLPVAGLRWWLQGLPAPGICQEKETEQGHQIEQDGWRVIASDYTESAPLRRGPHKVELTRDNITVRIVISEWQWQTSPQT